MHRSDNSGTTENFTATLSQVAPQIWTEKASGDWPAAFQGEGAQGTSGVVAAVQNGSGTIGYADVSGIAEGMSTVSYSLDGMPTTSGRPPRMPPRSSRPPRRSPVVRPTTGPRTQPTAAATCSSWSPMRLSARSTPIPPSVSW